MDCYGEIGFGAEGSVSGIKQNRNIAGKNWQRQDPHQDRYPGQLTIRHKAVAGQIAGFGRDESATAGRDFNGKRPLKGDGEGSSGGIGDAGGKHHRYLLTRVEVSIGVEGEGFCTAVVTECPV